MGRASRRHDKGWCCLPTGLRHLSRSHAEFQIDFNTLPDETLYRYLEYHDLLPRWDASPWSEDPCTPRMFSPSPRETYV